MNDETSPGKVPSRKLPQWVKHWLLLAGVYFAMLVVFLTSTHAWPNNSEDWLRAMVIAFALCGLIGGFTLVCWQLVRCLSAFSKLNLKRFAFLLACLATMVALLYAEEDWRGWHAWSQFKQEWEAKGETFSLASVAPAPVPDEQNFATAPIVASSYEALFDRTGKEFKSRQTNVVNRMDFNLEVDSKLAESPANNGDWRRATLVNLAAWQTYFQTLALKTNRFPVHAQPQSPAADVLLALSAFSPGLEELRAASQRPYSRFPLNYEKEPSGNILLPHLGLLKQAAQTLRLRAVAELQTGQSALALEDFKLSLRLADSIRTEPFLISHLVRIAMFQIALQPAWEGLAKHQWSEAQLETLDTELAKLDFAADYQYALRGERALCCTGGDQMRRHRKLIGQTAADFNSDSRWMLEAADRLLPAGWFYQNELHFARLMSGYYLPVADVKQGTFSPALARECVAAMKAETKSPSPFNLLARMASVEVNNLAVKFAHAQASATLARTAIALERYHLRHNEYPATLDALTPEWLAPAPKDVIGGTPLKYQRTASGQFLLYSVGWNETDDGGSVALSKGSTPQLDNQHGDWVWRYSEL
jgi:hypothetical protein